MAQYNYILVVGEEEAKTGQVQPFIFHLDNITRYTKLLSIKKPINESLSSRLIDMLLPVAILMQVSVRVRDGSDHSVMSLEALLEHFKEEVAAFH